MKTFASLLLLFFSTCFLCQQNTLLWKIEGNGLQKPSYIYGTYHSNDYRTHQFGDSVLKMLSCADVFIAENVNSGNKSNKEILEFAFMKKQKLENLLNKEDYSFVKVMVAEKMGTNGAFFNNMKPIFTMIVAGQLNARKEMEFTVDEYLKHEAASRGKKLYALETNEEAQMAIDAIPLSEQSKMLLDYFRNYEKNILMSDSIIKTYQSQDLANLYNIYKSHKTITGMFDKSLIDDRNVKFMERFIPLMKEQSVFCAVGALHLPGETGLINALRKKGYIVKPIYSKYHQGQMYLEDKREWFNYGNDTLMISINLPNDPFLEIKASEENSKIETVIYTLNDSAYNLKYSITIINIADTLLQNSVANLYDKIVANISSTTEWLKTKDENISDDNRIIREVEFNTSKGLNNRNRIIKNGKFLYILTVSGTKEKIYSNVAEKFFNENKVLNPMLFLSFNVLDEATKKPIEKFGVNIKANSIDTLISADSIGHVYFSLPNLESEYMITVLSPQYVSKKVLINTINIGNISIPELHLNGEFSMIKKAENTNYSIFDKPVAKARFIVGRGMEWDMDYINEMKIQISKSLK